MNFATSTLTRWARPPAMRTPRCPRSNEESNRMNASGSRPNSTNSTRKSFYRSFLQNGLSEVDFSWAGRGEPGCVRSGRGGPVVDDANDLIDGERDDAEHEMAFDLERAADAEKSGAELVFQTGVDAFGHGAEIVDQVVEVGHVD